MIHFHNPQPNELTSEDKTLLGTSAPEKVRPYLSLWRDEKCTPLVPLPEIAELTGVAGVYMKDEGQRLGLGSFKALGGAYAVMTIFKRLLEQKLDQTVSVGQLLSPTARKFAPGVTFCCATDGNHGKSVAAGARILGCRSVIFIHDGVTQARADAIGADEVVRVEGNYDFSVEEAERVSREKGWQLVSDTSWPGYEQIPSIVSQGYTILAHEALIQMEQLSVQSPTHVFLQAGVGGFASSIAVNLGENIGHKNLTTIIVEPDRAACLLVSAQNGKLSAFEPGEATIMAMLECYTPSLVAWRILDAVASAFMTVSEDDARDAMRRLANRDDPIVAGESGAAGLAGLLRVAGDPEACTKLGLDRNSRILLINTEGATDPASYESIVGTAAEEVSNRAVKSAS
ncbi:diaminopropionate ammonia-lyase [Shinella curvata]|uniref:Diaminopropionate ammonia-lyase n=1 Tax=Shinella curvata TaxID=1817964 RepID=A0ABT8XBZ3_9HYPH|nr:diaminopropionate ammonia-lyase [Shinella curvata]MCJ8054656.1 diaminopropionate ammonia-lyase [Shinella curvata]MDO6120949.1 diaminopropionate ammonia-lyase [Shinella curvata]